MASISDPEISDDTITESTYSAGSGQTVCPTSDCQAWTSAASGQELVLAFNTTGELVEVFDANSSLAATFTYATDGCVSGGTSESYELCTATEPDSSVLDYTYQSSDSAPFLYDMVSETPPGDSGATDIVYNSSGQISQETDPSGEVFTYSYAGTNSTLAGGTTTVTAYPDGTGSGEPSDATIYQFSSNVLVAATTGSGTTSASTSMTERDPASLLPTDSVDGDGNVSTATYQTYDGTGGTPVSSGNVLSSTDALGNTTAYAYNSLNQQICSVDPADDANGANCDYVPSSVPAAGSYGDDGGHDLVGESLSLYNSDDELTAKTGAVGDTTIYSYTDGVSGVPDGLMYCSVDPVDYAQGVSCPAYGAAHVTGTTSYTFDSHGNTLSVIDPGGATTSDCYYDQDGTGQCAYGAPSGGAGGDLDRLYSATDPDGTLTSYTYNAAGQTLSQTASFGSYSATSYYAYDSSGRQWCSDTSQGVAVYGDVCALGEPSTPPVPSSHPTSTTDPYLGATVTTYDANGRAVQSTNPLGGVAYTGFDQAGYAICTISATSSPSLYSAGKSCPTVDPTPPTIGSDTYLGMTITTYDANGEPVQVTNPLGASP